MNDTLLVGSVLTWITMVCFWIGCFVASFLFTKWWMKR